MLNPLWRVSWKVDADNKTSCTSSRTLSMCTPALASLKPATAAVKLLLAVTAISLHWLFHACLDLQNASSVILKGVVCFVFVPSEVCTAVLQKRTAVSNLAVC